MIDVHVCSAHVNFRAFPTDSISPTPILSPERHLLFCHIYQTEFRFVRRLAERFHVPSRHSEDMAHDVFLAVWHQFDKYDESRPIKPWLRVFVARMTSDYHALMCHSREVLTARDPDAIVDEVPSTEDRMQAEEERQIARQAVNRLDPALHEVLMLNVAGWTAPKIAARLGIPLDTAYTRVRRAREKVHRYALCRLAERERRDQIRQVFPAARRNGDERPPRSKKRFDLRPRAARRVDKQGVRNRISG